MVILWATLSRSFHDKSVLPICMYQAWDKFTATKPLWETTACLHYLYCCYSRCEKVWAPPSSSTCYNIGQSQCLCLVAQSEKGAGYLRGWQAGKLESMTADAVKRSAYSKLFLTDISTCRQHGWLWTRTPVRSSVQQYKHTLLVHIATVSLKRTSHDLFCFSRIRRQIFVVMNLTTKHQDIIKKIM